jgi:hypothetical protein
MFLLIVASPPPLHLCPTITFTIASFLLLLWPSHPQRPPFYPHICQAHHCRHRRHRLPPSYTTFCLIVSCVVRRGHCPSLCCCPYSPTPLLFTGTTAALPINELQFQDWGGDMAIEGGVEHVNKYFFWIVQRDVTLRSAASPKPSPGNTGPVRLRIDVGRRGVQGEGGNKQDWRMGRAYGCVRWKYGFLMSIVHRVMHNFY